MSKKCCRRTRAAKRGGGSKWSKMGQVVLPKGLERTDFFPPRIWEKQACYPSPGDRWLACARASRRCCAGFHGADRRQTPMLPLLSAQDPPPGEPPVNGFGSKCSLWKIGSCSVSKLNHVHCPISKNILRTYSNDKGEGSWPWGGECAPR